MPTSHSHAVRLSSAAKKGNPSRVRTQFHNLIEKLEGERKRLVAWHDALPLMRSRAEAELLPLTEQLNARQRELVFLFDKAWHHKQIKKKERGKLSDLIRNFGFVMPDDEDDEELEAIFDAHSWHDPSLDDDPEFAAFSEMFEKLMFPEESSAPQAGPDEPADGQPGKKTSGKTPAGETRLAAEELRLQQSVRDIFRKLTSSLHPDRESDPAERDRKTALMQRVNVAYTNNDLLALLELQFEIDQIDEAALSALPEDHIKRYNKMLTRQVSEVRREIEELEQWLIYELHLSARGRITPALLEQALNDDIAEVGQKLAGIEHDLLDFTDIKKLKAFLKTYRVSDLSTFLEDDFF